MWFVNSISTEELKKVKLRKVIGGFLKVNDTIDNVVKNKIVDF